MKRLAHTLFTAFSALSLLLLIATVSLWVRSRYVSDWFTTEIPSRGQLNVTLGRGDLWITLFVHDPHEKWGSPLEHRVERNEAGSYVGPGFQPPDAGAYWVHNFGYFEDDQYHVRLLGAPLAFVCALASLAALRWLILYRRNSLRRRRKANGLCPDCGYDLRASRERCPECGRAVDAVIALQPSRAWATLLIVLLAIAPCLVATALFSRGVKLPNQPYIPDVSLYTDWQGAEGKSWHRMAYTDGWGNSAYRAIWRHDGQEFLVIIYSPGGSLANEIWPIYVFDRNLKLVSQGGIDTMAEPINPYCLTEVRDSAHGQWSLAIGFVMPSRFDPHGPIYYAPPSEEDIGHRVNWVGLYPVKLQLQPTPPDQYYGSSPLADSDIVQVRSAENDPAAPLPTSGPAVLPATDPATEPISGSEE